MSKDKFYGCLGTLLFHFALLLVMGFSVLRSVTPSQDEVGGVLVNFGNIDAAGLFEPRTATDAPAPATTDVTAGDNLLTQDNEESLALSEANAQAKAKAEADAQRQREEAIRSRVAGAFGEQSAPSASQGDASAGAGNQGSPFGAGDQGDNTGIGGDGASFNLNGRSLGPGGLPKPLYTVQEEGRIVIDITVDPNGNVILAEIGRGTNIDNASMRHSAREAAQRAKFNPINAANNQRGTITYIYKLTQ